MKKTKIKKKSTVKNNEWYRKQCVTMAKKIVRIQSGFKCMKCGNGEPYYQTHGSHIFAEGTHHGMSADLDNIVCLCASHHNWGKESWHDNPIEMVEWLKKVMPKRYEKLRKKAQQSLKVDFYKKWKTLKLKLKKLETP